MSYAEQPEFIDVSGFLELENRAEIKHEYVDGWMRAMTGATNRHNLIATNTLVALGKQLEGKPCQPFNSDTKFKIHRGLSTWFYYPDAILFTTRASKTPWHSDAA